MRKADAELFKDKIEVSLDGRQIFYLFFGGAVIASLVFVLGVMVGKRLESRNHLADSAQTSAVRDPLAALDELGAEERDQRLEFPQALVGKSDTRAIQPEVVRDDSDKVVAPKAVEPKAAEPKAAEPKAAEPKAAEPKVAEPKVAEPKAAEPKAAEPKAAEAKAAEPKAAPTAGKAKFTLQLSSFQDRAEAEAFHAELTAAGYQPYITEADVPGKGLWYRVRLGRYVTHNDALAAKSDFEKRQRIIAYVTRL